MKNALALQKYVREQTAVPSQSGWWQSLLAFFNRPALAFAAVTALFLMTAALVWTVNENARLRNRLQAASNTNDRQLAEQLSAERARTRELTDELERARREREVIAQELAELKANLPDSPRTPTFAALTLIPGLERGAANVIPLTIPAKNIPAGSYRVRLFGTKDASVERVANYYFDLEKR